MKNSNNKKKIETKSLLENKNVQKIKQKSDNGRQGSTKRGRVNEESNEEGRES